MIPDISRTLITGVHPRRWSHESLLASLQVKIRGGNKLFDHLRKKLFIPFPSVSTVNRFVKSVFCVPVVQNNSIKQLAQKFKNANKFEKNMVRFR